MTLTSDGELNSFFKLLVKCPSDRLQKLLHNLVDSFCGQENSSYSSFSDLYGLLEWWDLISHSIIFFKEIHSENKVSQNLELLPSVYRDIIQDLLEIRASDLRNRLIENSHAISPAYVKSFDWKLKLTLASDKMAQMNDPRLLLDLNITGDKLLQLDLSKDELKSLIDTMEKAKSAAINLMAD